MSGLWLLLALTMGTSAFHPMQLYIGSPEGVSFAFEVNGTKQYSYFWASAYGVLSVGADYKNLAPRNYTRMNVTEQLGADSDDFMIQFNYYNYQQPSEIMPTEPVPVTVKKNNDGTVALRCPHNGLYAAWSNQDGLTHGDVDKDGREDEAWIEYLAPICTEPGICPKCRFSLETGSINDVFIRLVSFNWGDPEDKIPSNPSFLAEEYTENYSEETLMTKLTVIYSQVVTDTTIWEHAWGFELSVSAGVEFDIPFIGGGSVTATATASYNGKYGTEDTVTNTTTTTITKEVPCPKFSRCTLKMVGSKLDDYKIPFTALVERTQDDGPPLQWYENGTWKGVQAFNFHTIYCTMDLISGEDHCPEINFMV